MSWIASRWRHRVPASRLLGYDMLLVGTFVNLLASVAALMLYAQGFGAGLAMLLHFAPLPYSAFLVACLWRHPSRTPLQLLLGLVWFALMALL